MKKRITKRRQEIFDTLFNKQDYLNVKDELIKTLAKSYNSKDAIRNTGSITECVDEQNQTVTFWTCLEHTTPNQYVDYISTNFHVMWHKTTNTFEIVKCTLWVSTNMNGTHVAEFDPETCEITKWLNRPQNVVSSTGAFLMIALWIVSTIWWIYYFLS